ncbi:MAG: rhomboid family intramembrane serine protease [Nanoarchaeota archaeon]
MDKWFENKFEGDNLRGYTKRRLNPGFSFQNFFRKFGVTTWIIIIDVIVFIAISIINITYPNIINYLSLTPNLVFHKKYLGTLFTSMFMHANFVHLFVNMISLFFLGGVVEKIIGRKRFFWFYLISGIIGGIVFASLSYFFGITSLGSKIFVDPAISAVGASGAIFGLAGLLAVLMPYRKVSLIAGPLIAIIIQAVLSSFFPNNPLLAVIDPIITIYIFVSIFLMLSFNPRLIRLSVPINLSFWLLPIVAIVPLVIIGLFIQLPIGNTAHLGGLVVGLVYGLYLRQKYKRKTAMISKYFS